MAQYGGGQQQQYRREVTQVDEHGNPVRKTDEHANVVHTDTGSRAEREVRHTDDYGNPIQSTTTGGLLGDYVPTGLQKDQGGTGIGVHASHGLQKDQGGTKTNTHGTTRQQGLGAGIRTSNLQDSEVQGTDIGHARGGTGTDYNTSSGRSTGQTGYQGHGPERGSATGGRSTGQTGYQGLGTERGSATGGHQEGLGQVNRGMGTGTYGSGGQQGLDDDYVSGGRSVGQTGYQGLGTERTTGVGGGGGGGGGESREKKGIMEKIKEKLPGNH